MLGLRAQNRVLPGEHTGHSKHSLPTKPETTHGNYKIISTKMRLIIFLEGEDREV